MKFIVTRTSNDYCGNHDKKPCDEAIFNGSYDWLIEINSLEELMEFKNKYGNIIIKTIYTDQEYPIIEIYDCDRE